MAIRVLDVLRHLLDAPQSVSTVRRAPARLRALLSACRKHHVVSACVLACLAHTPARAQTAYGLPSSERPQGFAAQIANRLGEWRQMIEASRFLADSEKIEAVNRFFNRSLLFANDSAVWGSPDHWATPMEFMERGRGDCEDFAIAKFVSLRMLGLGAERLRLVYVHADVGGGKPIAHMVVAFYERPGTEPVLLDNMIDSVRPVSLRTDLSVVYSFNTRGLWLGTGKASAANPNSRLSRWRGLVQRMRTEGMLAWSTSLLTAQVASGDTVIQQ
jgi:predicted transglutaminase-like cysteine proteinase